jgi:S-DNA-T family DNA segregation ATPase FtsK/SpoIIIE
VTRSILPPLDLVGPDGDRLTVRALDRDDTVRALADRLAVKSLWVTGRELQPNERLCDVDELRIGTRLARSDPTLSGISNNLGLVDVAVVAGPAASAWQSLPAGRHLVGRSAHAGVCVEDPAVEPHHALVEVGLNGAVDVVQLTGVVPIRVDGQPLATSRLPENGARLQLGASVIHVRPTRGSNTRLGSVTRSGKPMSIDRPALGSVAVHPSDPWRRIVWRSPYAPPEWEAVRLTAPSALREPSRPSFTSLIGVGVMASGAVLIATIMGNPMFMLFAAMGVIAAVSTFLVNAVTARRRRTRARAERSDALDTFAGAVDVLHAERHAHHESLHHSLLETLAEVAVGEGRLWQRRLVGSGVHDPSPIGVANAGGFDPRSLSATIGAATCRWRPDIEVLDDAALDSTLLHRVEACSRLTSTYAPITIRPGDAVAFHGPRVHARSVARSVVVQLATWTGPADWQLVVVSGDRREWAWADWLPHGALGGCSVLVIDGASVDAIGDRLDAIDTDRQTVLVTDEPHLFTARTGPLRRFVSRANAASLVVVDTEQTVPAVCRRILTIGSAGSATWTGDVPESDAASTIEFAGVSISTADRAARRLACLVDPEDDGGSGGGVPGGVSFAELITADAIAPERIAARWRAGGDDPAPSAPLGMSADGRIDIDLVRDGPHGLIAGTTGSGKSELLRTLVLSLAASVGPQHLNVVLVDYKGGSTFDACVDLPHTVGLVTDLDDGLAERALVSLNAELHRRERLLRRVGACDLTDYRARRDAASGPPEPIARLVVVIDEFAALAKELPDFLSALVGVAQRGRSLGVHLLLATQRPAGVVNDDIRANTNLRLALRLHDKPDAIDVVGDEIPAKFPRGLPGRAALRLGPDELVVFQAARCTGPVAAVGDDGIMIDRPDWDEVGPGEPRVLNGSTDPSVVMSELDATVANIVAAARIDDLPAAHRPWVEPLPFPLHRDEIESSLELDVISIGSIDDPEHQRRLPLTWDPSDGGLALIGSLGSGTTSTLIALATSLCRARSPEDFHLYVVDARGDDGLTALASVAHCGGIVRLAEEERLHRLLSRVVDTIGRRMGLTGDNASGDPSVVVMIDGFASLKASLAPIERQATFDLLQRLLTDGPAAGIALVVADEGSSALSSVPVAHRWLFHLDDPSAARGYGLRAAPVPHGAPGRLRILASGCEAQVAQGAAGLAELPTRCEGACTGPDPIAVLPEQVSIECLDRRISPGSTGAPELLVGVGSDDLAPAHLNVAEGDHVLIIGGARTGVSTALARLIEAWEADAQTRGEYRVITVDRRTPLESDAIADPAVRVAVMIDNAHRVDDLGLLTEIAKGEHPHVTVFAAARADAVRTTYGHWTREIAKSRCGIVLASRSDSDGDVIGVQLPRRPLIAARPGLGWIVDGGPLRCVQIAYSE